MSAVVPASWSRIERLVIQHETRKLVAALGDLDDSERKGCVPLLKALGKTPPGGLPPWQIFGGLAVAGAGILPDATTTATWLRRFDAQDHVGAGSYNRRDQYDEVFDVLVARDPSWLPRMVELMAEKMRVAPHERQPYRLIERLRRHVDGTPATSVAYVGAWAAQDLSMSADPVGLVRDEPRFAALVPVIFEIDEIAWVFQHRPEPLLSLAASGVVPRAVFLDAALSRLQRGGKPAATNCVVQLYAMFEPTIEETQERVRDLIAILPATGSTAAGLAQEALFSLHDAGLLPIDVLVEMSTPVFARTEKKLLRAQLARLRAHAATAPNDVSLVAEATASALRNPAVDVQRDAIKLINSLTKKHGTLDEAAVEAITGSVEHLPRDLAPMLAIASTTTPVTTASAAQGAVPGAVDRPEPPTLTAVVPIATTDELIEELLVLMRGDGNRMGGIAIERVVEAGPRLANDPKSREAYLDRCTALLAHPDNQWIRRHLGYSGNRSVRRGLFAVLAASIGDPIADHVDELANRDPAPQRAIAERLFGLAATLTRFPSTRVVSLPTWTTGSITTAALLARLQQAAHDGWQPDPTDLEQALLRMTPHADSVEATAFDDIESEAGRRTANWINAERPKPPAVTLTTLAENQGVHYGGGDRPGPSFVTIANIDEVPTASTSGLLWRMMTTNQHHPHGFFTRWDPEAAYEAWPLLLPNHRELVAAHLLPEMLRAKTTNCQGDVALIPLAEADGEPGPALHAALTYTLAAKNASTQAAATDALLILIARHQLNPSTFATVIATLLRRRDVNGKRMLEPLRAIAAAGGATEVWATLSHLIGDLLDDRPAVTGFPDLIALSADVALLAPSPLGTIEGLDAFASRKGSSRQLVEARRLRNLLTPTT